MDELESRVMMTGVPALTWASVLGGATSIDKVTVDARGNAWILGTTFSPTFAQGGFATYYGYSYFGESYAAKINADGTLAWSTFLTGRWSDLVVDGEGNGWLSGQTIPEEEYGYAAAYMAKINGDGSLAWTTFLNGSSIETAGQIALDGKGGAWLIGTTQSEGWVSGGYDTTLDGTADGFVARIRDDGSIAWTTYVGGSAWDDVTNIVIDANGDAWVAGTGSPGPSNDPNQSVTVNSYVLKLHDDGALAWTLPVGGSNYDSIRQIAVDGEGNGWVIGDTESDGWISGGYDTTYHGGSDGFVVKISPDGIREWSAYLGEAGRDTTRQIVTGQDSAWITALQNSSYDDFTIGDALLYKLNGDGTLAWSRNLGGNNDDEPWGMAVDGDGNAWVAGLTFSADWAGIGSGTAISPGDGLDSSDAGDGYLAKVNGQGTLVWATYMGGTSYDWLANMALDGAGNIWVLGGSNASEWLDNRWESLGGGHSFIAEFHDPTVRSISISSEEVLANQPLGTPVGELSITGGDSGDPATFALVSGIGSAGNGSFVLDGNVLKTNGVLNDRVQETYSIRVRVMDSTGLDLIKVFQITVLPHSAPVVGDVSKSLLENSSAAFGSVDFSGAFSDPDAGDSLHQVRIETLPAHGALRLNNEVVTQGEEIAVGQLGGLVYVPATGFFGSDSFQWNGFDGGLYAADAGMVNLTVRDLSVPQLAILQAPWTAIVGNVLPVIKVAVENQLGAVLRRSGGQMTVTIVSGPAGGALKGTARVSITHGVATFANLSLTVAGNYTLRFADSLLAGESALTAALTVTPGVTAVAAQALRTYANGKAITVSAALKSSADRSVPFSGVATLVRDDGTVLASAAVSAAGTAKFSFSTAPGTYFCTVKCGGDASHTAGESPRFAFTADWAASVTRLGNSPNTLYTGDVTLLSSRVSSAAAPGHVATGTVTFMDGKTVLNVASLDGTGAATFLAFPAFGHHNMTAVYSGDSVLRGSTSAIRQVVVNKGKATLAVGGYTNGFELYHPVTLHAYAAVVKGGAPAGGTVTFRDGNRVIGTAPMNNGVFGVASLTVSFTTAGAHPISARLSSDGGYDAAPSAVTLINIGKGYTEFSFTSLTPIIAAGSTATFSLEFQPNSPQAPLPTGTVLIKEGENIVAQLKLSGGRATWVTPATLAAGVHVLDAWYLGDGNNFNIFPKSFTLTVT